MRKYSGYKEGTNSRGLPSGLFETPEPKHCATSMDGENSFKQICERATQNINTLIERGDLPASFWSKGGSHTCGKKPGSSPSYSEVKPTSRQYRRYRNGHGLAFKYHKI